MQFHLKEKQNINSTALHNIRILLQSDTVWNLNFLRIIEEYLSKKILGFTMRRSLLHIFLLILLSFASVGYTSGTSPEEEWNKTYGGIDEDIAKCVQQTSDGGYIIAGSTCLYDKFHFWVLKTDPNGNEQWNKIYGNWGENVVYSVLQTSDHGYVIAGLKDSCGKNSFDFWLIKLEGRQMINEDNVVDKL